MAPQALLFVASALASVVYVTAQAAPAWIYFPKACASDCSETVRVAYSCETQFSNSTANTYGCFCNAYPSDATTCSTCLSSNGAAAVATLLTGDKADCVTAAQKCTFECSFATCDPKDVACQCSSTYLQSIYNCGACNTAKGNTGETQLSDWKALDTSCANQGYAAANASFTSQPVASATTQGYAAPALTATGGGQAATGDLTASSAQMAGATTAASTAGMDTTTAAAMSSSASSAAMSTMSTMSAMSTASAASGSAGGTTAAAAAAAASTAAAASSASRVFVPGLGGIIAFAGAIIALF